MIRVCQIQLRPAGSSETFLVADARRLPCEVVLMAGFVPGVNGMPRLNAHPVMRVGRKLRRVLTGAAWEREITDGYLDGVEFAGAVPHEVVGGARQRSRAYSGVQI